MSTLLELLGKGLERPFLETVLPGARPLTREEATILERELGHEPQHRANQLRLALHYSQAGSPDRARSLFRELLERHGEDIEIRLAFAGSELADSRPGEAARHLEAAHSVAPQDSRILFGLGYCAELGGQIDQAQEWYGRGTAGRPHLVGCSQRLAAIAMFRNDYGATLESYHDLQKEHPEDVGNYLVLGQLHLHLKQYQEAVEAFERAITIEPDNFDVVDDEVTALAREGDYPQAIERLQHLVQEQGEFPDHFLRLGDLYSQIGEDRSAVRSYQRSLELHPGYLEAAVKLGTQHLRCKRHCAAAGAFTQAVEINDRLILAYVGLGVSQHSCGKQEDAQDTLQLAAALEPNTNLLFAEIARLQFKAASGTEKPNECTLHGGDPASQEYSLDELLDLQIERHRQRLLETPDRAALHYRYAMLLRNRGRVEDALAQFKAAIALNPAYPFAHLKLGLALRESKDGDEAIQEFHESLRLSPEYAQLHYRLGLMYCDKMLFALAVEDFRLGVTNGMDGGDIQANLSLALGNMGLIDRAAAHWQAVCELDPQSTLAFRAQREAVAMKPLY